jgi:multicomponent Na+:H+ antiporter subunit F
MVEFLYVMAGLVLAAVAVGLFRILRGPTDVDRMMSAQLLGTGGIAALLLAAAASGVSAAHDLALLIALLAAFASAAFASEADDPEARGDG